MDHIETGRYFAICRPADARRPPYLRAFDFTATKHENGQPMTAEWYFLNRLDAVSCLDYLLPAEAFQHISVWDGVSFVRRDIVPDLETLIGL